MAELAKLHPGQLKREAWVYVRQSTMSQVREHTESLARQYELAERAVALGWRPDQVHVVDEDLGRSGAEATARTGFQALVSAVGLGKVGIVLGIEVSRLARNNADWYPLLDLCAMTDTLIGDADGIYHPGDYNDRLVLGLKGTMSEAELHMLRSRLNAGLRHKAARGELRQGLPVGLCYDEGGAVAKDPDEAVQAAISEVFRRFDALVSARQVMVSMRADGLMLPKRPTGSRRVCWELPTYRAVHNFLTNPAYAGAYVFGRTNTRRYMGEDCTVRARTVRLAPPEWDICITGHHPGYVGWEAYLANQERLRDNWKGPKGEGRGAPREGPALLQGLVRCGRCGRKMQVGYQHESNIRYVCNRGLTLYGSPKVCQSLAGRRLEAAVLAQVFAMLEPAALAATASALAEADKAHAERLKVFELAVERARYEAERTRRQFDACEPENRLVARTLERAWEERIGALRQAEADLAAQRAKKPAHLSEEELAWLGRAGADLRAVFHAPTTSMRERKQLLRALITEVVVTVDRPRATAEGHVAWEGGAISRMRLALPKRGENAASTSPEVVELVRRLAPDHDDAYIADQLNHGGHATALGHAFNASSVRYVRLSRGILDRRDQPRAAPEDGQGWLSLTQAQAALGVSRATLQRWLVDGFATGRQAGGGRWEVRVDEELRAKVLAELPEGWARLDQAARALGVARQTVLDRIRRGELRAVHVQQGRRFALAIELPRAEAAGRLFGEP